MIDLLNGRYLPRMWVLMWALADADRTEQVQVEQAGLEFSIWCKRESEALCMLCGALPSELA